MKNIKKRDYRMIQKNIQDTQKTTYDQRNLNKIKMNKTLQEKVKLSN